MTTNKRKTLFIPSLGLALASALAGMAFAAERITIVSEGDLAGKWATTPAQPAAIPGYPETFADKTEDACVAIGYQINSDGSTTDFTMLKAWGARTPDSVKGKSHLVPLSQAAAAIVRGLKYNPANGAKAKPVFTAASFAFSASPNADRNSIRGHCLISDLPAFIARAQADAYKRGNLMKSRIDRSQIEQTPANPYVR